MDDIIFPGSVEVCQVANNALKIYVFFFFKPSFIGSVNLAQEWRVTKFKIRVPKVLEAFHRKGWLYMSHGNIRGVRMKSRARHYCNDYNIQCTQTETQRKIWNNAIY